MREKDRAVRLAKQTLEHVWDGTLPVRPDRLAGRILMSVTKEGSKHSYPIRMEARSEWDLTGASGEARCMEEDREPHYLCLYNADEHPTRQRFTMAHELGHVMLGHVKPGEPAWRDMTFNSYNDINEIAANAYAAELLMPEARLREYAELTDDVAQLAGTFGVSPSAVTNRLRNLGIIDV